MGYPPFSVTVGGVAIDGQTHGRVPDGLYVDWDTGASQYPDPILPTIGLFPCTTSSCEYTSMNFSVN